MTDADVVREALTPSLDWTEEELAPALAALSRMEARMTEQERKLRAILSIDFDDLVDGLQAVFDDWNAAVAYGLLTPTQEEG